MILRYNTILIIVRFILFYHLFIVYSLIKEVAVIIILRLQTNAYIEICKLREIILFAEHRISLLRLKLSTLAR